METEQQDATAAGPKQVIANACLIGWILLKLTLVSALSSELPRTRSFKTGPPEDPCQGHRHRVKNAITPKPRLERSFVRIAWPRKAQRPPARRVDRQ